MPAPGCYSQKIRYNTSLSQIQALIGTSQSCYQQITNACTKNALTNTSWWTDPHGRNHTFWHGDGETIKNGCYCSINDDGCSENNDGVTNKCNCDSMKIRIEDVGIISQGQSWFI